MSPTIKTATAKKTANKSVKQIARATTKASKNSANAEALISQPQIDEFCDTLWLEDGLAKNSLDAYRRDLSLFAAWLQAERGKTLLAAHADDLNAYFFAT
jgi:integrase/recombinase XerD